MTDQNYKLSVLRDKKILNYLPIAHNAAERIKSKQSMFGIKDLQQIASIALIKLCDKYETLTDALIYTAVRNEIFTQLRSIEKDMDNNIRYNKNVKIVYVDDARMRMMCDFYDNYSEHQENDNHIDIQKILSQLSTEDSTLLQEIYLQDIKPAKLLKKYEIDNLRLNWNKYKVLRKCRKLVDNELLN